MTSKERLFHVALFQLSAGLLSILIAVFVSDRNVISTATALIVGAGAAMSWNWIFNLLFDKIVSGQRSNRSIPVRILHALIFEFGILVMITPLYSALLSIHLLKALILNVSIASYFLVYTFIFNWTYDQVRDMWMNAYKPKENSVV